MLAPAPEPPSAKYNYQEGGKKCRSAEETQGVRGAGVGKKAGCTYILN